jgi:hypothetical protein
MGMTRRVAGLLAVGLLAATGCKPGLKSSGGTDSTRGAFSTSGDKPELAASKKAGEDFLAALKDGKAGPDKLTVGLKKALTDKLVFPKEKELGYSDSDAEKWLAEQGKGLTATALDTLVLSPSADRASIRGTLTTDKGKDVFALRLAKQDGGWLVERWHRGPGVRAGMPHEKPADELLWARELALDFLDDLLSGDRKATAALMAPTLKAKLAKPVFSDDEKVGYSALDLDKWLASAAEGLKTYTVTSQTLAAGGTSADFAGEFSDGKLTVPFKLSAAPEKGEWLVSAIETGLKGK